MARKAARPVPTRTEHLTPLSPDCLACGRRLWADYRNRRTVATLEGLVRLVLDIRRCHHSNCAYHLQPYRPEAEGRYALPQHEFGLDVIAWWVPGATPSTARCRRSTSTCGAGAWPLPSGPSPTCWTAMMNSWPSP